MAVGGLFCKPEVLLEMKREWMSDIVLDFGDAKLGQKLNELGDISCPECSVAMDKTYDSYQRHIWFEACPQCEGVFFDAGEFSDLKYETFMDRVRYFTRGLRPAS